MEWLSKSREWLGRWIHNHPQRLFIFLFLFLLPIMVFAVFLFLAAGKQGKPVSASDSLIILLIKVSGIICFIFGVLLWLTSSKGFGRRFSNWIYRMIDPLITGAPLGMLVSMIYLSILIKTQASDFALHFASVVGLYLAFVGLFIAFYGIYVEKTLILDIDTFMDFMIEDIKKIEKRFFWCYPGLSFGSISARGDRYQKFKEELLSHVFMNKKIEKEIFVFSESEIKKLYEPYIRETDKIKNLDRRNKELNKVCEAIKDSGFLLGICKWGQNDQIPDLVEKNIIETLAPLKKGEEGINNYRVKFLYDEIDSYLRFQIIIIDDNVYILTPFGLPQKFGDVYEFTHNPSHEHPVDFHVTRITSKTSAEVLIDQIKKENQRISEIKREK